MDVLHTAGLGCFMDVFGFTISSVSLWRHVYNDKLHVQMGKVRCGSVRKFPVSHTAQCTVT